MKIKESLKDRIINSLLYKINWFRCKVLRIKSQGNQEPKTYEMNLVFYDNFKKFDDKIWRVGQPWGQFHPEYAYQYYSKDAVSIKDNSLVLGQFYSPKKLKFQDNSQIYDIPQAVGLITSYDSFGYGFYKFECKLPKGMGLWPAIWLSCDKTWPPEIDILEAYSNEKSDYKNDLQSNFHYDFDQNKKQAGARNHPVYSNSDKISLGCHFTKDFIKIYYNGYLVRQITSDDILKFFRDKKMIIILNNAIRAEYKDKLELINQKSEFLIYNVSYYE
jgi:hypothetical protein